MKTKPNKITKHAKELSALGNTARYLACKAMAKGYAEARKNEMTRLDHARAFCAYAMQSFWKAHCIEQESTFGIKPLSMQLPSIPWEAQCVAESIGRLVAEYPVQEAGFLIGSIYTTMLPPSLRSSMGAYYTPPALVERLIDMAVSAGFHPEKDSALDPACGGGAFLAPLALRMIKDTGESSPEWILHRLAKRLKGIELDPFAAWITTVVLDATLLPLSVAANRRFPDVVEVADALTPADRGKFDLVIGNPPYGRITLDAPLRSHYARGLYGHANLYGLFTDLALRLVKPNGVLAYLTPTSFLGGQYFKALRELLTQEATPVAIELIADRDGVFDGVLQETLLTTYHKQRSHTPTMVSLSTPTPDEKVECTALGGVQLDKHGGPWLLPRQKEDMQFITSLITMPTRLSDLGFEVSTGPLVWNRHKTQLRYELTPNAYPLIWAESVTGKGFEFTSSKRQHVPYIEVTKTQKHLVTVTSCLLVQRTTSKEQSRRLIAAVLPAEFAASMAASWSKIT